MGGSQMNKSFLWAYDDRQGWNYTSYFSFFNDFRRHDENMKYTEISSIAALCLISLTMNIGLIIFFLKSKELRTSQQNMYIVSVNCSSIVLVPFALMIGGSRLFPSGWPYGDLACKSTMYIYLVTAFIKIWLMTLISVDRYLMVVHLPKYHIGRKLSIIMNVCAWVLPGLSLALMVYYNTEAVESVVDNKTVTICSAMFKYHPTINYSQVYFSTVFILEYILPASIMTVCYVLILKKIKKSSKAMKNFQHGTGKPNNAGTGAQSKIRSNNKEKRTTHILITILILFLLMWTPLFGFLAMLSFDQILEKYLLTSRYVVFQLCMLLLNTIIEPVLFACTTGPVRHKLSQMLRKVKPSSRISVLTAETSLHNYTQ